MPSLSDAIPEGGHAARRDRIPAVDVARGVAVAAMAVYHLAWDLSELRLIATEMTAEPGWRLFSRAIAASFLLLVGVGLALAHADGIRWRAFWRRLATVGGAALLITAATYLAYPDSYIFFGILHCIALSSLIALPFVRAPASVAAAMAALVWAAPLWLGGGPFEWPPLAFLGLASRPPITNDWVPLLPWAGFVFAGIAAGKVGRFRLAGFGRALRSRPARGLAWAGRHSLAVYLLHQPILLGALAGTVQVTGPNLGAVASRVERTCPASYVASGFSEPVASATCACTVADLKARGLWADFLRERLGPEGKAEIGGIARACLARSRASG